MAYPKQPERLSLRGLTMTLEAGKVTASAGKSGSEKSTVLAVLQRFYEVQLGSIQLDGVDVSNMSAQSLRKRIALVSQAAVLFEGSIRLNLSLGSPEPESVTQADLDHACQQACILDFVRGLPDGFETDIGLKGLRLSGGQRHRLCIARALLAKADISLLDEATSALNAKSEALVEKALRNASVSRTTIVIAHKLQSLLSADKIVVLHEGAAVEEGTHAELMAKDEHYRRLVENQLQ